MKYKFKSLIFVFLCLVLSSFIVSGALTDDNEVYYSFDDDNVSGTTMIDLSPNSNDGTCSMDSGCDTVTGYILNASDFDGVDDFITISNESRFDFDYDDNFSIGMWIKKDFNGAWELLYTKMVASGDYTGIQVFTNTDNTVEMQLVNDISPDKKIATKSTSTIDTNWHQIVFTYNGNYDASSIKVYVDGVDVSNNIANTLGSSTLLNNANPIIGKRGDGFNFDGKIDEFGIWNRTLTSDEVEEWYNLTQNIYIPSAPSNFTITANSFWDNNSINNFSANINGTIYNTTTGTITTSILKNSTSTYDIIVYSDNHFNTSYNSYSVSADLEASLKQSDITLNFRFSNGELVTTPINLTSIDNNYYWNVTGGFRTIYPDEGNRNFSVRCNNSLFAPFNITIPVLALDNLTINYTVNETPIKLKFIDAKSLTPIDNANLTIKFPSGGIINKITNSSGDVNFTYIYNNTREFGDYTFTLNKVGYINTSFSETINESQIPFSKTYNVSRAKLTINVYDRVTSNLLTGVNVSVAFIGLFNETTSNGSIIKDNLTIIGGDYLMYASADGYKTSVRSLTFTNQEEFTINFYLLNLSEQTAGTLFVTSYDSFYRNIEGAKIELLQYVPSSLSFISVDECVSNVDAQCSFAVELNTKIYYIRGTAIIDGSVFTAETNQNGEILTVNNDNRDLIFYTLTDFSVEPSSSLIYSITESFVDNVSTIGNSFYSLDGNAYTVCIEYFKEGVSVTNDTYCLASTSALQNVNVNMILNRSYSYTAEIYIKNNNGNINLGRYVYPSNRGINSVLGDTITSAIIIALWMFTLAFCVYSKNMVLWFSLSLVLSWVQLIFFPLSSIISFAVFKTLISILCLLVARKKRDVV